MKDPLSFVIALFFLLLGVLLIIRPHWAHKGGAPEHATRDRRRLKLCGFLLVPIGLVLLGLYFSE